MSKLQSLVCTLLLIIAIALSVPIMHPARVSAQTAEPDQATPTPADENAIWFVLSPEGEDNGAYFDVELDPGETANLVASVGNGSAIPVKAIIYAADAYTAINGGFALKAIDSEPSGPTTWLDFPRETHDFEPLQGITKSFSVTVPEGTAPGQYITGIAIETADARAIDGGSPLTQKTRLITAVLITVPGPVTPAFSANDLAIVVSVQGTTLSGTLDNTGNIRVRPEGTFVLTDLTGKKIAEMPIAMGSVYAHDSTQFILGFAGTLPEGDYLISAELNDPDTGAKTTLTDIPVSAAAPIAASPLTISSVVLTPSPSADNVVFLQAEVTVNNTGAIATGGSLLLRVLLDGQVVDEHELASSLTLNAGDTVVSQPYIPADGSWAAGTYTFEVDLSTTDNATGATSFIGTFQLNQTLVIE